MLKDLTYIKEDLVINDFKKLAIFASFSINNTITDDVIFYLRKLSEVVDAIIFVADNQIEEEEITKIKELVIFAEFKKHGKYDFGSYQRGFFWAKDNGMLDKTEEIVFCNDSVCGSYQPISKIFEKKIADGNPDFYGHTCNDIIITKNLEKNKYVLNIQEGNTHIQSYFFIISKNIFNKDYFFNFMKSIKHIDDKYEIIKQYEIGLSDLLKAKGCSIKTFNERPTRYWEMMFDAPKQYVFLKKSVLCSMHYTLKINRILRKYNYPYLYANREKLLPNTLINYITLYLMLRKKRIIKNFKNLINKY